MTTVLALAGAFGNPQSVAPMFQGKVAARGTFVPVSYRNSDPLGWLFGGGTRLEYVLDGVAKLDAAINSTPGHKVVVGHSLGSLVAQHWLVRHGKTSSVPVNELEFVFGGNSIHRFNGQNNKKPDHAAVVAEVKDTRYKVVDIVRQYDIWADYPSNAAGKYLSDAVKNVKAGDKSPYNLHVDYKNVDPDPTAATNVSFVDGNWTYVWSKTDTLPLFYSGWTRLWYGLSSQAV